MDPSQLDPGVSQKKAGQSGRLAPGWPIFRAFDRAPAPKALERMEVLEGMEGIQGTEAAVPAT